MTVAREYKYSQDGSFTFEFPMWVLKMKNQHSALWWLLVAVPLAVIVTADEIANEQRITVAGDLLSEENTNRARLLVTYATTTYTVITAKTSTVYFSCLSGTAATVCGGRGGKRLRRRSMRELPQEDQNFDEGIPLEASPKDENIVLDVVNDSYSEAAKNAKFGITIWTTTKTTSSVTVFYTNTASTLRISYYCVAGGINLPATPCAG